MNVKQIVNEAAHKAAEEILTEKRARLAWCKNRLTELSAESTPLQAEIKQLKKDIIQARRIVAPFRKRVAKQLRAGVKAVLDVAEKKPEVLMPVLCIGGVAAAAGAAYVGSKVLDKITGN